MNRPLVLLATVSLLGVIVAACGRGSGGYEAAATAAADATPSATLTISAKDLKFDKKALVVPAGAQVTLRFENEDVGALHNVAIYSDASASRTLFRGELFEGRRTVEYSFPAPPAGVYYFRCDAHPDMNGAFIVR